MPVQCFDLCGVIVRVEADQPAWLAEELTASLGAFQRRAHQCPHVRLSAYLDPPRVEAIGGIRLALGSAAEVAPAVAGLALRAVVDHVADRLALHAAGLATAGRAVILPAPSGAGKTTLALALLARGWDFLTDELVLIDPRGAVTPCPRALRLRAPTPALIPGLRRWVRLHPLPSAPLPGQPGLPDRPVALGIPLRQAPLSARPAVAAIVFPEYRPHRPTTLTALPPGVAAIRLLQQTLNGGTLGGRAARWAIDLAAGCPSYALSVGSLAEAADAVANLLA